ncbi:hypothetical protein QFC24_000246 [Naganishia onofrii]|uniref:Uncharacterized protein n=1 Tax=Naganishia onofrii TaxID=1851511 RepID=A0ACC2XVA1_9TREE|nr:hypothetical protein QFC24_000246 [Naganishia onofrii]
MSEKGKLTDVPEIEFYRTELGRALKELEFGVNRYTLLYATLDKQHELGHNGITENRADTADSEKQSAEMGKNRAIAMVEVLEGQQVFVDASSLKGDKPDSEGKTYDTLDSLLLNLSPGFMRRVNERLEERLWSVFAERETHEANEIEERE